jgi:hypothetical protein
MQELAGRLTALDPEASASLKVIAYFDTLVAGGVGIESLVRAAAVLSGAAAGADSSRGAVRVDADGRRTARAGLVDDDDPPWPTSSTGGRRVWIEREGPAHANDAMILDRLSLAVAIVDARRSGADPGTVEIVLDGARPAAERAVAAARLRLDPATPARVWALPEALPGGGHRRSTPVAVEEGIVHAVLTTADDLPADVAAGHSLASVPDALPEAWRDARIALRLSDPRHPIVAADDLGALIVLAREHDPSRPPHPDVRTLVALDPRTRDLLDELVEADSVRAAASALGLHHSTLQARLESLTRQLGYDPRSPLGRSRYEAARLLSRLR